MFTQFIEECSFVSDRHACLEFFDECVQKVRTGSQKQRCASPSVRNLPDVCVSRWTWRSRRR